MRRKLPLLLLTTACAVSAEPSLTRLAEEFQNPPIAARPRAFWNWLNGDVSPPDLTRDLREAKAKGMGGLEMWDTEAMRNADGFVPAGPPFMGPESVAAVRHCMEEAGRLGLELNLIASSGWNAGGPWVPPAMASKNLFFADVVVTGPGEINQSLPFPKLPPECPMGENGMPLWSLEVAVLAWPDALDKSIPERSRIVDLTSHARNGELKWTAPAGKWRVSRFICSNNGQQLIAASPNSKGPFIDFLDPEATRFHFEHIIHKLGLKRGGDPSPLKSLEVDSMELHPGIQWTPGFPEWFKKQHGYDPVSWLPVLAGWTVGDATTSGRFRYDYQKSVSDLLIFSHYTTGSAVCAEYGLGLSAEAGGPGPPLWDTCPVDALKALGNVTIPRGEFWIHNPANRTQIFLIKEIASAAHIYGKPLVEAESWTTWRRWSDGPFQLKRIVDRAFCEGLNRVVYHGFANSPEKFGWPGRSYHAGADLNPRTVWWPKARPFMDYLARCCQMLQQGRFIADVAFYYGDQAPNFWPMYHDVPEKPLLPGLGAGYDYDVLNSDVILNHMSVKDGRIQLQSGMSYRVLVLPDQSHMPLEVLEKLDGFVRQGATIIGPKPGEVPGWHDHEVRSAKLRRLADAMWGACDGGAIRENRHGVGTVVWGRTAGEWLAKHSISPDFSCADPQALRRLDFIHRQIADADIYFVRNTSLEAVTTDALFRVTGRAARLWDPGDGRISPVRVDPNSDASTRVALNLPPGGSIFVVFSGRPEELATPRGDGDSLAVDGPWKVTFDPARGAPASVGFTALIPWTEHPDRGVKYYSGAGLYQRNLDIPAEWLKADRCLHLDLGDVREVGEVFLNGRSAGIVWKPPFRVDVTGLARPGTNELKIEVMNLWCNRLAGDADLPPERRLTRSNIPTNGSQWKPEPWKAQPAGLLGPVRLLGSMK